MALLLQEFLLSNLASEKHRYTFVRRYKRVLEKLIWTSYFSKV